MLNEVLVKKAVPPADVRGFLKSCVSTCQFWNQASVLLQMGFVASFFVLTWSTHMIIVSACAEAHQRVATCGSLSHLSSRESPG